MHCFLKRKKNPKKTPHFRIEMTDRRNRGLLLNLAHVHTIAHSRLGTSMSIKQLVCIKITKTTPEHRYESNKEQCNICLKTTLITKHKIKSTKYID